MQIKYCPGCAAPLQQPANFCAQCGFNLKNIVASTALPKKAWVSIGIVSLALFGAVWFLQGTIIGNAPSQSHSFPTASNNQDYVTDEIRQYKETAERSPSDIKSLKLYATALWNKLTELNPPPQQLLFDVIEVLGNILKLDPNEPQALVMMANVSFNQKIFDKAADYYARYLALNKDDFEARASYASALTFLGQFDKALTELDGIIKKNPNYFQGIAYKAITLAQMGRNKEALELGSKALSLSPNDEARARFGGFLDSLKGSRGADSVAPMAGETSNPVDDFIKQHQIAGPKFVRSEISGTLISVYFKNFPMAAMPEFVRDSFVSKTKAAASKIQSISEIRFIDEDSKEVMIHTKVNEK